MPMMSIGLFVFELPTLAYTEMTRATDVRHARTERFGARPANQFLGAGEDKISLTGLLAPNLIGDRGSIDTLRAMMDTGDAHELINGEGIVLGHYIINAVDERQSEFTKEGVSRLTDFAIDLVRIE